MRVAIVTPADERRGVAEPPALDPLVRHFTHEDRIERDPRALAAGRPPALTARRACLAAEPGATGERGELLEQLSPLGRFERRCVTDVVQVAVVVVEAQQQ